MSVEDFAEELKSQLAGVRMTRFEVTRESPLTLVELTGDEVLTEGDEDLSLSAWVRQYRKAYGLPRGTVVLLHQEEDGWTAVDVDIDSAGEDGLSGLADPATTGTSAPAAGAHQRGEIVWNEEPSAGGFVGWVCTASGTPGTWKTFGAISA